MLAVVCLLFLISGVSAWGQEGHQIVASIAWNRCQSSTKTALKTFLGSKSLSDIAPLPDDYDHSPQGTWSDKMHYVNVPKGSQQFNMDGCPALCVVKALTNYSSLLQKQSSNPFTCNYDSGVEPCALEFLTHFTGDIHQPLHVSYAEDRGGNDVRVMFYTQQTNLHACWDTFMISKWEKSMTSAVSQLMTIISQNSSLVQYYESRMDPMQMASESFDYVLNTVYNYPMKNGMPYIGDDYYNRNLPIIQSRLIGGGVRLAKYLNNIFANRDMDVEMHAFGEQMDDETGRKLFTKFLAKQRASKMNVVV
jgi:hypothetical protein